LPHASQFAPSPTTFGTIPRNSFRGPGYFNTDLGLKKTFRLTERFGFTLGANAYNILNHPNFANPVSDLSSSAFGTIINAVQLRLRLTAHSRQPPLMPASFR
jgi:hypothetical protein